MSVKFRLVHMFDRVVRNLFPRELKNIWDHFMTNDLASKELMDLYDDLITDPTGNSIYSPKSAAAIWHNFFGTEHNRYLANSYQAVPPDGFTFRAGVTTVV
mgnify:CR=1 FL=1